MKEPRSGSADYGAPRLDRPSGKGEEEGRCPADLNVLAQVESGHKPLGAWNRPLEAPLRLGMSSRAVDELRPIDVAHYLGVSGQRVSQLASEQGFPRPRHRADGTRFWRADVNEQWAERRWWGSKPWRT
jgi:hypothetical protein